MATTLVLIFTLVASVYAQSYIGCYVNDPSMFDFLTMAPHADPTQMNPILCSVACTTMGYYVSRIQLRTLCFCKKTTSLTSNQVSDSYCFSPDSLCSTDPAYYCGTTNYSLVYASQGNATIQVTPFTTQPAVSLFNSSSYTFQSSDPEINNRTIFRIRDRTFSNYSFGSGPASLTFIKPGYNSIEVKSVYDFNTYNDDSDLVLPAQFVSDSVSNMTLACPSVGSSWELLVCDMNVDKGINTNVQFTFSNNSVINFTATNSEYFTYGIEIPQILPSTVSSQPNTYIALNTMFKFDGNLRAVELYAASSGSVTIGVYKVTACSGSYSNIQNYAQCSATYQTSQTFSCSGSYSVTGSRCSNEASNINQTYTSNAQYISTFDQTVSVTAGYNLITTMNLYVQNGWMLGLSQSSGIVALDASNKASMSDIIYSGGVSTLINTTQNVALYIRALVTRPVVASLLYQFTTLNNNSLVASVPGTSLTWPASFSIYEPITFLSVYAPQCLINSPCTMVTSMLSGSVVQYTYYITMATYNSTVTNYSPTVSFSLPLIGIYTLRVYAWNPISNMTTSINVQAINGLTGGSFFCQNQFTSQSASVLNQNASFLFLLRTGTNYNCTVNYGDGSSLLVISDSIINYNNTIFLHTYTREDVYTVSMYCKNYYSTLNYSTSHTVQSAITGLSLATTKSAINTPFSIVFSIKSGSSPNFVITLDNVAPSSITYQENALSGFTSQYTISQVGVYTVIVNASNLLSRAQIVGQIQIGSPIVSPTLNILTPSLVADAYYYEWGYPISLNVGMSSGTNVRVELFTGEETDTSVASYDETFTGSWTSNLNLIYSYTDPGDYVLLVRVSNAFNSFDLSYNIFMITNVSNVVPYLKQDPVIYTVLGATAYYMFSFYGNTKSAALASVTFNPGDLVNATFGPYALGLNYKTNMTTNQFMYRYTQIGTYYTVFNISNILGWKIYFLEVVVTPGAYGLYVNFPTQVAAGSSFLIQTYLMQGDYITYTWTMDGVSISKPRLASSYLVSDNCTFPTTVAKNTTLLVLANQSQSQIYVQYNIEIQNPVTNVTFSTLPVSTSQIFNDLTDASRTVVFMFQINNSPTNPFYIVDYGDGSAIALPQTASNQTITLTYVYSFGGDFVFNLTVFNKISSVTVLREVKIYNDFAQFKCSPRWRPIDVNGTQEIEYKTDSDFNYIVYQQHDLRLRLNWFNTFAETILLRIGSSTTLNFSDTSDVVISSYYGQYINYSKTIVVPEATLALLASSAGSTALPIEIEYANALFTRYYSTKIKIVPAVIIGEISSAASVLQPGLNHTLQIDYITLAEPSCASITITISGSRSSMSIGSDSATCSQIFPSLKFVDTYQKNGSYWFLTLLFSKIGYAKIDVNVSSQYSSQALTSYVTVSNKDCLPPIISIQDQSVDYYSPAKISRSEFFTIVSDVSISCGLSVYNAKYWTVYRVNSITGSITGQVSLKGNLYANSTELPIQANTLSYGLYKFELTVAMYSPTTDLTPFTQSSYTYIEIIPTGIVVLGLSGGVNQIQIGSNQTFSLAPTLYSYDQDYLISMSSLSFKFYCKSVDAGVDAGYPKTSLYDETDLSEFLSTSNYEMSYNSTCFNDTSGFSFDSTLNRLTINPFSLAVYDDRVYKFKIEVVYLDTTYYQEINLIVLNTNELPVISIACVPFERCDQGATSQVFNANSQITLKGVCLSGCSSALSLQYQFQMYKKFNLTVIGERYVPYVMPNVEFNSSVASLNGLAQLNTSHVIGSDTLLLTILPAMFELDPYILFYRIDLTVTSITTNGINSGTSSIIFRRNQIPKGGSCSVTPLTGISMSTNFTISCTGWTDLDGYIERYEFYATYSGIEQVIGLGFNTEGTRVFQLQQGPDYTNNRMLLYVQIYDNDNGYAQYFLPNQVTVKQNTDLLDQAITDLLQLSTSSSLTNTLFAGSTQTVLSTIQSLVSMINSVNYGLQNSQNDGQVAYISYQPYQGMPSDANFDNLDSLSFSSEFTGADAPNLTTEQYEASRLQNSKVIDQLVNIIANTSISNMQTIKMFSSVLNTLTLSTDQLSLASSTTIMRITRNLLTALDTLASEASLEDITTVASNLMGSIYNTIGGISNSMNGFSTPLETDMEVARKPTVDKDLEYPYNNPFQYDANTAITNQSKAYKYNTLMHKYEMISAIQVSQAALDTLVGLIGERLNVNQTISIATTYFQATIGLSKGEYMSGSLYQGLSKISFGSFCSMYESSMAYGSTTTTTTTINPFYTPEDTSCSSQNVAYLSTAQTWTFAGHNGDNETMIQASTTVGLSFYMGSSFNKVDIRNISEPILVQVARNPTMSTPEFADINITRTTQLPSQVPFLLGSVKITAKNSSLFIQIKPESPTVGYFVWIKYTGYPYSNSTYKNFDKIKGFCPADLITNKNASFYQFFMNSTEVNKYTGFIGYGFREMDQYEYELYCNSSFTTIRLPINQKMVNFTQPLSVRAFTAGCYYYNPSTGYWSSNGMEVSSTTTPSYTSCESYHLTEFAGGFVVLPNPIDFDYVFANASFAQNPTLYVTLFTLLGLFVIMSIWARFMDKRDDAKLNLTLLPDNDPSHSYCYELIVFSGTRYESGTKSKVRIILSGDEGETGVRQLNDTKRRLFNRGGIDSFIMAVPKPLGELMYLRIWHDNSGRGAHASWFLKYIVIKNLQTGDICYFICDQWLAVEKSDGSIDRVIVVATQADKKKAAFMIKREAQSRLTDKHLWFSMFTKPVHNSYSRLERVTTGFVILFISMLIELLYYDMMAQEYPNSGLFIGPFHLTPQQIGIGIICTLMAGPPSFLVHHLFENSTRRVNQMDKMESYLNKQNNIKSEKKKKKVMTRQLYMEELKEKIKEKELPYWCKYIGFILAYSFTIVCVFFIFAQGVTLGDLKMKDWVTSFVTGFFSEMFLNEPMKIVFVTMIVVFVLKKDEHDEEELEFDQDDDEANENKKNLNTDSRIDYLRDYSIGFDDGLLSESEITKAREKRIRETIFTKLCSTVVFYLFLIFLLCVLAYSNIDDDLFLYKNHLNKFFIDDNYTKIKTTNDLWDWMIEDFAPKMRINKWYNGDDVDELGGFLTDFASRVIAFVKIRQLRVDNGSCEVNTMFDSRIHYCTPSYKYINEDEGFYSYSWTAYNESYEPEDGWSRIYSAFQYQTSEELGGDQIVGEYGIYDAGGFVYEMRGPLSQIIGNLTTLQELAWIDRQTRAVFIEFNLYNPNLNLFSVCLLSFEILSTGNLILSNRFDVVEVLNDSMTDWIIQIVAGIIYIIMISYITIVEGMRAFSKLSEYKLNFKNINQWLLIFSSWALFSAYNKLSELSTEIRDFMAETNGYEFINMELFAYWKNLEAYFFAMCIAFATLRFLNLFVWQQKIVTAITAYRKAAGQLFFASLMFLTLFFAFSQMFYLMFGERVASFSSFANSCQTLFIYTLQRARTTDLFEAQPNLGPVMFSLYNLMVTYIFSSLYFIIMNSALKAIRAQQIVQMVEYDLSLYFEQKWAELKERYAEYKHQGDLNKVDKEETVYEVLPRKFGILLTKANTSFTEKKMLEVYSKKLDEKIEQEAREKENPKENEPRSFVKRLLQVVQFKSEPSRVKSSHVAMDVIDQGEESGSDESIYSESVITVDDSQEIVSSNNNSVRTSRSSESGGQGPDQFKSNSRTESLEEKISVMKSLVAIFSVENETKPEDDKKIPVLPNTVYPEQNNASRVQSKQSIKSIKTSAKPLVTPNEVTVITEKSRAPTTTSQQENKISKVTIQPSVREMRESVVDDLKPIERKQLSQNVTAVNIQPPSKEIKQTVSEEKKPKEIKQITKKPRLVDTQPQSQRLLVSNAAKPELSKKEEEKAKSWSIKKGSLETTELMVNDTQQVKKAKKQIDGAVRWRI